MKKEIEVKPEMVILSSESKEFFLWESDIKLILPIIKAEASRLSEKSQWTKTEPSKASDFARIAKKLEEIVNNGREVK